MGGSMRGWTMRRTGVLMEPRTGDPMEVLGVLNPASARNRDGTLYLFARLVAERNHSRVGRARVLLDADGDPVGVERLGVALEAEETWERNPRTGGGIEDPRIVFVPTLDRYIMSYTAYGPLGPRIALAVSEDLVAWERLGPVQFDYEAALGVDLNLYQNKDALLFSEPVPGPDGTPSWALLHRPVWYFDPTRPDDVRGLPRGLTDHRPGIWLSYAPVGDALTRWSGHRLVALPERPWEDLKIGGGTPPVRTPDGWLVLYHGVTGQLVEGLDHQPYTRYAAGALLLDPADVGSVLDRSVEPLLTPELDEEREGIVPNVVFPTAIEPREDGSWDVFYGMADWAIGAARLWRVD
jgi:predicted GH43/DUF377 family glycosyl hydrolase